MACNNIEEIVFDCGTSTIGGISAIYVADSNDVVSQTAVTSAWTVSLTMASGATFEVIEFRKNAGSYVEDYTRADDGAVVYSQTINLTLHGRDAAKSRKINILGEGQRKLDIIVRMNSGKYVYFKETQLQTVAEGSGALKADGSKYAISFLGEDEHLAYYMEEVDVLTLI